MVSVVSAGIRPRLTVGSRKQHALGIIGLLSETGVTSPQLHGDTIGGIRASVETEVGALVLDHATGEVIESLVVGRGVAVRHGDRCTVTSISKDDGAEVAIRELDLSTRGGWLRSRRRCRSR
jgi:hypothetical protein